MFILTFSHTGRDFCFYCLQLNLTAGTKDLALIKGGLSFLLKKGGKLKWGGGGEIKGEGLKSITNCFRCWYTSLGVETRCPNYRRIDAKQRQAFNHIFYADATCSQTFNLSKTVKNV